ncbi:MAG: penicillin-binding protein 2 [Kiritimatiellae bacterium]|nr:penicillin-binding protein 2 [Kiritimatiellia bacterium]
MAPRRTGDEAARATLAARLRFALLCLAALSSLAFLLMRLHDVQVRDRDSYASAQDRTSLRRVRLPATRGRILDRKGRVLARSVPRFCAALYLDELRAPGKWSNTVARIDAQIDELSRVLGRPREIGRDAIWKHLKLRRPIPLVAFSDLGEAEMARLAELVEPLRGVDFFVRQDREYPFGDLACHVIGYVGKGTPDTGPRTGSEPVPGPDESGERPFDYLLPDLVGRSGVEKNFDETLSGRGGAQLLRIDALGYKRETIPAAAPEPGRDVTLAIDASVQKAAEDALGDNLGAAVVLSVTGDTLALASSPRYDLRSFVPVLPGSVWERLSSDRNSPLVNRALSGTYPPGSTVKPAVALSALAAGAISRDSAFMCDGGIHVGSRRIKCSSRWGHGYLGISRAIAVSCNPFFIETGLRMGWEGAKGLRAAYDALGFGHAPRIGIEVGSGFLPSDEWKRRHGQGRWLDGDTANVSIGQGGLTVTPLQAARMALAIATGGKVMEPRLVLGSGDGLAPAPPPQEPLATMPWRAADVALVRAGMIAAVEDPHGTARRLKIGWLPGRIAAKTGTAEYGFANSKNFAWTIAFAPADSPRCAIAVVAEDSDHGGQTAASIVRKILVALFPPPPGWEDADDPEARAAPESAPEAAEEPEDVETGEGGPEQE